MDTYVDALVFNETSGKGWPHERVREYVSLRARVEAFERAELAWTQAKEEASRLSRLASRATDASGKNPGYHANLAHAAMLRRARTEIGKQLTTIAVAQAALKVAEAQLAAIQAAAPATTTADRRYEASVALEHASQAKIAQARAKTAARRLRPTPGQQRRMLEIAGMLRERGINPDRPRISIDHDEDGKPHRWTYYADEHGRPRRTDEPLTP